MHTVHRNTSCTIFTFPDRHSEFVKLEQSIREVHELFLELSALVSQQGEMVNSIAYNVEQASDKVEKGREQLQDAERYQRAARRKKMICFIILFLVVVIVLLVILSEFGAFSSSPDSNPPPIYSSTIPTTPAITTTSTNTVEPPVVIPPE